MGKILGLTENTHRGIGAIFFLLFLLGLVSGYLSIEQGDVANATYVLSACTVIGLIPALIFLFFAAKLAKERGDLERLGQYLARKERSTVSEVAAEFKWSEPDAEDKIVTALAENKVAGNFDRGTRQFYTVASMQSMEFVAKCGSCGAGIGLWASRTAPAKCSYCGNEPRPGFVPPPAPAPVPVMYGPQPGVTAPYAPMHAGGAPAYGMPTYGTPAGGMPAYGMPAYGAPAPMAGPSGQAPPGYPAAQPYLQPGAPPQQAAPQVLQATPPGQVPYPPGQGQPVPPAGPRYISPYPEGTPPPPPAPPRKRTVKFLFFSMRSGALKSIGFPLFILGVFFLAAAIAFSTTYYAPPVFTLMCTSIIYLPLLLIGGALIVRAYREEKYREQLLDIVDYIETYRRIPLSLLAQKMNIPGDQVRKIIFDIMEFQLVEGYLTNFAGTPVASATGGMEGAKFGTTPPASAGGGVTPDGSEFIISLRKEDVRTVSSCPYCRAPNIYIQVIRGGSEKCPYCSGVIFFQEGS